MISELIKAAERFRMDGKLPPTGYKPKTPKWIINLQDGKAHLEGPYSKRELKAISSPDRQRSGTSSEENLKPYLLLDDARYVLGKAEAGKEEAAALMHRGFISLLRKAFESTRVKGLAEIIDFLESPRLKDIQEKVEAKDIITFRVNALDLSGLPELQKFWSDNLAQELVTKEPTECCACGKNLPVLQTLPREIVIQGQKCQLSSFNKSSFTSFGKEQTTNAPLCFTCGSQAIDALDYLIRSDMHHRNVWFNPDAKSSLENQLAIFWLDRATSFVVNEINLDVEALLVGVLDDRLQYAPQFNLSQIHALLSVPWKADHTALAVGSTHLKLAVASANKGRMVLREWLDETLDTVKENLTQYLNATCIVSPWGEDLRPHSIANMLQAAEVQNPNFVRGLLRTAYLGYQPSPGLLALAVNSFRNPKILQDHVSDKEKRKEVWRLHPLASLLKLGLYFGTKEVTTMTEHDPEKRNPAYLCGSLFAVLEEAQQVSHYNKYKKRLDTTIVNRFYGSASTAPAVNFGNLIRQAATAHLPDVGRELNLLVEDTLSKLDEAGGFPNILTLAQQAEFGLGFYHQRAKIRANRGKSNPSQGEQK